MSLFRFQHYSSSPYCESIVNIWRKVGMQKYSTKISDSKVDGNSLKSYYWGIEAFQLQLLKAIKVFCFCFTITPWGLSPFIQQQKTDHRLSRFELKLPKTWNLSQNQNRNPFNKRCLSGYLALASLYTSLNYSHQHLYSF